jgi:hypothetical protein
LTAWYIYRGADASGPLHGRFDHEGRPLAGSPQYPIQVGIAIPLLDPGDDGLAQVHELPALEEIERTVVGVAEGQALLVGVITTAGTREYVLYTGDGEWLEAYHSALSPPRSTRTKCR